MKNTNSSESKPTHNLSVYESWKFLTNTSTVESYLETALSSGDQQLWSEAVSSIEQVLNAIRNNELTFFNS
jgi:DNA-binding phage protein